MAWRPLDGTARGTYRPAQKTIAPTREGVARLCPGIWRGSGRCGWVARAVSCVHVAYDGEHGFLRHRAVAGKHGRGGAPCLAAGTVPARTAVQRRNHGRGTAPRLALVVFHCIGD